VPIVFCEAELTLLLLFWKRRTPLNREVWAPIVFCEAELTLLLLSCKRILSGQLFCWRKAFGFRVEAGIKGMEIELEHVEKSNVDRIIYLILFTGLANLGIYVASCLYESLYRVTDIPPLREHQFDISKIIALADGRMCMEVLSKIFVST
jgi:hypothetical protein